MFDDEIVCLDEALISETNMINERIRLLYGQYVGICLIDFHNSQSSNGSRWKGMIKNVLSRLCPVPTDIYEKQSPELRCFDQVTHIGPLFGGDVPRFNRRISRSEWNLSA